LPEEQQDAALEVLRRERLKLISLTPVRSSLEEYYIRNYGPRKAGQRKPQRAGYEFQNRLYRLQHFSRGGARPVLYNLIAFALLLSGAAILWEKFRSTSSAWWW